MSGRFAWIIEALFGCVASRLSGVLPSGEVAAPLPGPLVLAVWRRLNRLARRFERLVERARDGTLPQARSEPAPLSPEACGAVTREVAASREAAAVGPALPSPRAAGFRGRDLPRRFGWLIEMRVPEAADHALRLRMLLQDPAMVALVSSHPAFGRVIRPLCHMLKIAPHPELVLLPPIAPSASARRRVRVARPPTPPWTRPLPHCDGLPRPRRAGGGAAPSKPA